MVYLVARCAQAYTTYHQAGLCQGYAPGAGHSALPGEVLPLYTTYHQAGLCQGYAPGAGHSALLVEVLLLYTTYHHVGTSTNDQCVIEHFVTW